MPAEHVLTPDDKCPCGKPQEGSGYCSYECFSKFEMGSPIEPTTSPVSMGGPLSEADPNGPYCECSAMRALVDYHLKPISAERDELRARVGVLEGQLATAREELGELLPIASPYRTTKADRDRNWLHGAWESFAARAKTARAAANRWAREADRLEEWAAKRKSEKDAGTWPPCQGCDEHPARALGLDGGDPDER